MNAGNKQPGVLDGLKDASAALALTTARQAAERAARAALIARARTEGYLWREIASAAGCSIAQCISSAHSGAQPRRTRVNRIDSPGPVTDAGRSAGH